MGISFQGHEGNELIGTRFAPRDGQETGEVVLLLHGGGQTRHSWNATAKALAERGHSAITIDQRGHGDSQWSKQGNYSFDDFAADLAAIIRQIKASSGRPPIVIGASLGGMAAMIYAGNHLHPEIAALILVDITPHVKMDGVEKILGFMGSHAQDGFATLEEAADAIAAYLPHRPRPKDMSGLAKNLRQGEDGRYRWHWDPAFLTSRQNIDRKNVIEDQLSQAVSNLDIPVLLVRGRDSELVGEAEAAAFLKLAPHAKVADVGGARHMVAGDKNDVFADAVLKFIDRLNP